MSKTRNNIATTVNESPESMKTNTTTTDKEITSPITKPSPAAVSESKPVLILTEAARIALIGPTVAAVLVPLDVMTHVLHTKIGRPTGLMSIRSFALSASRAIVAGYPSSAKASTIKNGFLVQRHGLEERIESTEVKDKEALNETTFRYPFLGATSIALGLGGLEAAFTNYLSNDRAWRFQEQLTASSATPFKRPVAKTPYDTFKMFRVGYNLRASKSFITVYGYVINPHIAEIFKNRLPESKYVNTAALASNIAGGLTVGPVVNILEICYKNQVTQMCPETITSDSAAKVMKGLIAKEGVHVLRRGLATSVVYTTFSLMAVPQVEKLADAIITTSANVVANVLSKAKNSSFFQPSSTQERKQVQEDNENELDYAISRFNPFS